MVLNSVSPTISLDEALNASLSRISTYHQSLGDLFPTFGNGTGYLLEPNDNWLAGFWTGNLWLTYSATGNMAIRVHAETLLSTFEERLTKQIDITHDLGFLFTLSAVAQWKLTGNEAAQRLGLRAADALLGRFRKAGKYIQAWGEVGDPHEGGRTIADTMMNVALLFWASQQSGDHRFQQAAIEHAETTRRHLVREDGSTYHTFFFDQHTGKPIGPRTHQGYADDSLWARGQAWVIYGFACAAEWCRAQQFIDTSWRAAQRYLAELSPNGVPWWDLRLPEDGPQYLDSSAGAIAAAGLLRLARLLDKERGDSLRDLARQLLQVLVNDCFEVQPKAQGLLRYGTYHAPEKIGTETYLIFGDYFFLEALLASLGNPPDFWGPSDTWYA